MRVYAETADMVAALVEFEGGTTAALVERLIGSSLRRRYARIRRRVEAVKAIKAGDPLPGHEPVLGGESG